MEIAIKSENTLFVWNIKAVCQCHFDTDALELLSPLINSLVNRSFTAPLIENVHFLWQICDKLLFPSCSTPKSDPGNPQGNQLAWKKPANTQKPHKSTSKHRWPRGREGLDEERDSMRQKRVSVAEPQRSDRVRLTDWRNQSWRRRAALAWIPQRSA